MTSLLDQSALSELADRLVGAARSAGADAADAVAVRSMSLSVEVREGAVEESQRAEGDDVGLRVFVGRRQAVVSTNDIAGDVAELAERAVAMAKVAPKVVRHVPIRATRGDVPISISSSDLPSLALLGSASRVRKRRASRSRALPVGGRLAPPASAGAGDEPRLPAAPAPRAKAVDISVAGEAPRWSDSTILAAACRRSRRRRTDRAQRRQQAVERINPRKVAAKRVDASTNGCRRARRPSRRRHQRRARSRARRAPQGQAQRILNSARIVDDPLRGGRSRPFAPASRSAARHREAACSNRGSQVRPRASSLTTTGHAHRAAASSPSPGATNLHLDRGSRRRMS